MNEVAHIPKWVKNGHNGTPDHVGSYAGHLPYEQDLQISWTYRTIDAQL